MVISNQHLIVARDCYRTLLIVGFLIRRSPLQPTFRFGFPLHLVVFVRRVIQQGKGLIFSTRTGSSLLSPPYPVCTAFLPLDFSLSLPHFLFFFSTHFSDDDCSITRCYVKKVLVKFLRPPSFPLRKDIFLPNIACDIPLTFLSRRGRIREG